jgi:hypothetical protein
VGKQIAAGGMILGVGRLIMSVFPGLSISGNLVLPAGVPIFGQIAAASTPTAMASNGKALPAATSNALSTRYAPNPNYGSVTQQFSVGL